MDAVAELRGQVWNMAQSPHGTWVVQDALDNAPDDVGRIQLVHELKGHVWDALRCPFGNHVLQKCLTVVHAGATQFVLDELLGAGHGAILCAAKHQYGCRVLQRILEHLSTHQLTTLVHELVAQSGKLSKHLYGHYVIRSLLEQCPGDAHQIVSLAIGREIESTMRSRYGRAVVADALTFGGEEDQRVLAHTLVVAGSWLHCVGRPGSRYLPTIARRMLLLLPGHQAQAMRDSLMAAECGLKHHRVGRKLLAMRESPPRPAD